MGRASTSLPSRLARESSPTSSAAPVKRTSKPSWMALRPMATARWVLARFGLPRKTTVRPSARKCGESLDGESDPDGADLLALDQRLVAEIGGASVRGRAATGRRAGQRMRRLGDRIGVERLQDAKTPGCAGVMGHQPALRRRGPRPEPPPARALVPVRLATNPRHRASVATSGRMSALASAAPLGRRRHPHALRAAGADEEARGPGTAAPRFHLARYHPSLTVWKSFKRPSG